MNVEIEDTEFMVILTNDQKLIDGKVYSFFVKMDNYLETIKYEGILLELDSKEGL